MITLSFGGGWQTTARLILAGKGETGNNWFAVKDGDTRAVGLFRRHYTARKGVDYLRYGFSGNGESLILLTLDCLALWCWRRVVTEGINCSVFHNEGSVKSSILIREATMLAWEQWPGERLFTYVNPRRIRSSNPGFCFLQAGWRKCGLTKKGLIILELRPDTEVK